MNKKIIAFVLATALLAGVIAPAVGAEEEVTIESLNKIIAELLARIDVLEGKGAPVATGLCLTSDLSQGMTSAEVKTLQQGLNQNAATQVAAAGAGAAGAETTYFGPLTKAAVVKFQELYAAEVLASWGLTKGTGFVGSTTRTKFNDLYCTPKTPPTTTPDEDDAPPAYGSLSVVEHPLSNPVTTVYGGQTYELVAGQYKATGSDMTIKKISVEVENLETAIFPWLAFTSISVWDGSTKLAELPVTEANAIEKSFAGEYKFDISGMNWKIAKDTKKVLTVKLTVVPGVSVAVNSKTFKVRLLHDGVVSTDTAKVTYTSVSGVGDYIESQTITINDAKQADFTVSAASGNPKAGIAIGSKSATSKVEVLKFNLRNNTDISATFTSATITASSTEDTVVSLELYDGDTLLASAIPPTPTTTATWTNFSLPIAGDTTKTLIVKAVIIQLPDNYTGGKTVAITEGPCFRGIDGNSNIVEATGTGVTGGEQAIYLAGPVITLKGDPTFTITGDTTNPNSFGTAKIAFNVLAAGKTDVYLHSTTSATSTVTPDPITLNGLNSVTCGFTCTGDVEKEGDTWRITADNAGVCTLTTIIELASTTPGKLYQVAAKEIYWGTGSNAATTKYTGNLGDFITGEEYMSHK